MLALTVQIEDAASEVLRGVMARMEDAEGLHEAMGTAVRPGFPVESWMDSERPAMRYAGVGEPGSKASVVVEIETPAADDFKDVSSLVRWLVDRSAVTKRSVPPEQTENEWMLPLGIRYAVRRVQRDRRLGFVRVLLQPFPR